MQTARLYQKTEQGEESFFPLQQEVTKVGRNPENHIVLNDGAVSRFHVQILHRGDEYFIRDLGSTHGTFVNDKRNDREQPLHNNDQVRIGATVMVFQTEPGSPRPSPPSQPTPAPEPVRVLDTPDDALGELDELDGRTIAYSLPSDSGASSTTEITGKMSDQHSEMLSRVAEAIQSVFDLNELLRTLMDVLFDIFKPDRGVIMLREEPDDKFVPRVWRPENEKLEFSHTILNHAVSNRMSLLVADMAEDERFSEAQSIMAQSILAAICCPLVCKDKVLGVLYIDTQSRLLSYQEEDLALLNIIAANAAIAIENAILIQEKLNAERLAAVGMAVAGISHYIKNILTGIHGSSQLIDLGINTDNIDVIRKAWPILNRSNEKIQTLVKDMLTFSKKREPIWEDGNLNDVLEEIHQNQLERARNAGIELVLETDPELPDSQFDSHALLDALLNIAANAVEACEEVPQARVVLRSSQTEDPNLLAIHIIDNGMGIPEDIQQKILEPFFSTKGSKGTGLGLAVSRKTIEEHHGQLLLESEPGKGTTFKIYLPIRPADTEVTDPKDE